MYIHTTTPPAADETGPETEQPAPQASRFDERGIALQTIIIMVVLLAIAASVAGVLLSRAGQETERLEASDNSNVYAITNETGCNLGGYNWTEAAASGEALNQLNRLRPGEGGGASGAWGNAADKYCAP